MRAAEVRAAQHEQNDTAIFKANHYCTEKEPLYHNVT